MITKYCAKLPLLELQCSFNISGVGIRIILLVILVLILILLLVLPVHLLKIRENTRRQTFLLSDLCLKVLSVQRSSFEDICIDDDIHKLIPLVLYDMIAFQYTMLAEN